MNEAEVAAVVDFVISGKHVGTIVCKACGWSRYVYIFRDGTDSRDLSIDTFLQHVRDNGCA